MSPPLYILILQTPLVLVLTAYLYALPDSLHTTYRTNSQVEMASSEPHFLPGTSELLPSLPLTEYELEILDAMRRLTELRIRIIGARENKENNPEPYARTLEEQAQEEKILKSMAVVWEAQATVGTTKLNRTVDTLKAIVRHVSLEVAENSSPFLAAVEASALLEYKKSMEQVLALRSGQEEFRKLVKTAMAWSER